MDGTQVCASSAGVRYPSGRLPVWGCGTSSQAPYVALRVNDFDLSAFVTLERLYSAFQILRAEGGLGEGTDGIAFADFENSEIYEALRLVSRRLGNHDYGPHETRPERIPKGDGRYRELLLQFILGRVIAKALQVSFDRYWRTRPPRLGKDVFDLFATTQRLMRQSDARFLVVSDIRDCFPSAPIDAVLECHRRHIPNTNLLWPIENVVRRNDGPEHTTGPYQGSSYSPAADLTLELNAIRAPLRETRAGLSKLVTTMESGASFRTLKGRIQSLEQGRSTLEDRANRLEQERASKEQETAFSRPDRRDLFRFSLHRRTAPRRGQSAWAS